MQANELPLIVITMAGLSQRFTNTGFSRPKYMLEAHGISLFEHAVLSFKEYFGSASFLFVARDVQDTRRFLQDKLSGLGLWGNSTDVVFLGAPTQGQAQTAVLGLQLATVNPAQPIVVFNIDTFRYQLSIPKEWCTWDGYLEVFRGVGTHWSFVKPALDGSTRVVRTTEKERISDLCSTGLYYFGSCEFLIEALSRHLSKLTGNPDQKELYIAPLYNELIEMGLDVHYNLIDSEDVEFCGTPEEYKSFLEKDWP